MQILKIQLKTNKPKKIYNNNKRQTINASLLECILCEKPLALSNNNCTNYEFYCKLVVITTVKDCYSC